MGFTVFVIAHLRTRGRKNEKNTGLKLIKSRQKFMTFWLKRLRISNIQYPSITICYTLVWHECVETFAK